MRNIFCARPEEYFFLRAHQARIGLTEAAKADLITLMKSRFETLDGMRGLAALAVFGSHLQDVRRHGGLLSHSFLTVDFFFLLSGFVIGSAYERKLSTDLTLRSYAQIRLTRLYPMIVAGVMIGFGVNMIRTMYPNPLLSLPFELLFIPFYFSTTENSGVSIYPLNPVQWSLFFEFFVNSVHAISRRFLTTPILIVVTIISAGVLAFSVNHYGTAGVGYDFRTFLGGFPRAVFSFSAGLLIFRLHSIGAIPRFRVNYLWPVGLLAGLLIAPKLTHLSDTAYVIVALPALLIAGLMAEMPAPIRPVAVWARGISYPLYAIHYPLLQLAAIYIPLAHDKIIRAAGWAAVIPAIIAAAWLFGRFYDTPVRAWLARTRVSHARRGPAGAAPADASATEQS
jgi:peptidoglycan/LPS O-acetylase OafA/YrhL